MHGSGRVKKSSFGSTSRLKLFSMCPVQSSWNPNLFFIIEVEHCMVEYAWRPEGLIPLPSWGHIPHLAFPPARLLKIPPIQHIIQ